ncbi:hypothetical protein PAECIP111894_01866 [Paenibacillus pseudetheri]|uniref:Uncharacterized protein n=1 Tax=Paenibacillus pseudetheri TaxID=2897682 RepID=A0ABM9BBI0_9BACL|nr:hypothetical protein PAECIP111894_01866 [Paenibacillus pseudetheri]
MGVHFLDRGPFPPINSSNTPISEQIKDIIGRNSPYPNLLTQNPKITGEIPSNLIEDH